MTDGNEDMWDLTPPEGMSEGLNLLRWALAFVLLASFVAGVWAWSSGAYVPAVILTTLVIGCGWGIEKIISTLPPAARAKLKADQARWFRSR